VGNERGFKRGIDGEAAAAAQRQATPGGLPNLPTQATGPVPTLVSMAQCEHAGESLVLLFVSTPAGVGVYYLDPDAAMQIGQQLLKMGRIAKSGLVVADGSAFN
jgi:hypothetical protein